jgi:hypothetical protein
VHRGVAPHPASGAPFTEQPVPARTSHPVPRVSCRPAGRPSTVSPYAEACTVFCAGPLLEAVQTARLWPDSKTFVDMPLVSDPADVLAAFGAAFPGPSPPPRDELTAFVSQYFQTAGSVSASLCLGEGGVRARATSVGSSACWQW